MGFSGHNGLRMSTGVGGLGCLGFGGLPNFDGGDLDSYIFARADGAPTHPQLLSDAFKKLVTCSDSPAR